MSNKKNLPYARQSISTEDLEAVSKALSGESITRGPIVDEFEREVAAYCGAKYGVAFNTGTAALMATYEAANVGKADRVLTTPNTFVASIGPGIQRSATPVFLDIDRKTGNIDLEHIHENINITPSRGKNVVVPVHFTGIPVDMEAIDSMISDPDTIIIEDAAHAIGSRYKDGTKVGSCAWSHMTIFSFHPAKTLTTGEGGMVMTNDDDLYHRLLLFRNNGIEKDPRFLKRETAPGYYEVMLLSGNYNFMDTQAALGLSQLKRLDTFIEKRRALMKRYHDQLQSLQHVSLIASRDSAFVAPHLCVVQIDFQAYRKSRSRVMEAFKERGIGTQVHYIPVYRHPFFAEANGDLTPYFPETETYYSQALSLPLYYDLTEEDVDYVVHNLKDILEAY